jgi:Flp pilus assembly protein TadB
MYYSALAWLTRLVEVLGPMLLRRSVVMVTVFGVIAWALAPLSGPINVIPVIVILGMLSLWMADRFLRKR